MLGALALALVLALVAACGGSAGDDAAPDLASDGEGATPPNIVFILTDDQRWDSVDQMVAIDSWDRWARFEQSFVHQPICCPSRATALTGQFSHHTTVEQIGDIADFDESDTVATRLQDAGYATGFFGKYMVGYPDGAPTPPGWTSFVRFSGTPDYTGYRLDVDGTVVDGAGYSTDELADRAVDFIRDTPADQPLFVAYWPFAPHGSEFGFPVAADRHQDTCAALPLPSVGVDPDGGTDEPAWVQRQAASLDPFVVGGLGARNVVGCQALQAVDEAFTALLEALDETGRAEDTYIVFTSDNGWSFGERGLEGKGHLYDESIRVPLLVAGPGVEPGTVDRLTSNIDLVPTFLDWADAEGGDVDGGSFADVLTGESSDGPDAVLLRGCGIHDDVLQCLYDPDTPELEDVWGVRTVDRKLVAYADGSVQLFDLERDPDELDDVADDPAYAADLRAMQSLLDDLMADAGAT